MTHNEYLEFRKGFQDGFRRRERRGEGPYYRKGYDLGREARRLDATSPPTGTRAPPPR